MGRSQSDVGDAALLHEQSGHLPLKAKARGRKRSGHLRTTSEIRAGLQTAKGRNLRKSPGNRAKTRQNEPDHLFQNSHRMDGLLSQGTSESMGGTVKN